jgi:transglutaminase-like putative cysteine protease
VIYRVRHVTRYDYGTDVQLASHLLHLRPRVLAGQRIASGTIRFDPIPTRQRDRRDHFGNDVSWLFQDMPHSVFEITSESVVEVGFPAPPEAEETLAWEAVVAAARAGGPDGWEAAEFATGSPLAPAHGGAAAYATSCFTPGRPVLAALMDLNARICQEFTFKAGVTTISTPIERILETRQGVCQDFTHLMIGALRGVGLPARYVSGYIRTRPPPGQTRRRGADQSHAWVGCWLGPAHGWVDLDPTNGLVVRDEHVVVGWGRDFGDVSPVRGVLLGGGVQRLTVNVDLEPVN